MPEYRRKKQYSGIKKPRNTNVPRYWQRYKDSNLKWRSQSPECYRYTIPLYSLLLNYYNTDFWKCKCFLKEILLFFFWNKILHDLCFKSNYPWQFALLWCIIKSAIKSVAADKKEEPVTIPNTEVKLLQIQPFAVICRAFFV